MNKVKYGVVGVGALGKHHARWAGQIEEIEFKGIYDIDGARAAQIGGELECEVHKSLDSLLNACDAVSVVVTTTNHVEVSLQAIDAGKHLLVEKPIAPTVAEAEQMIAAAAKKGVKLTVGHIERFNPALLALEGYRLQPRFIEAHRLAEFNPRGTDVAVVLDLMIHDIDLALHLIKSDVVRVDASSVEVVSDTKDIANARITFASGAVANLTASRISLQPMRKLRIFQESGYYSLDLSEKRADLYRLLDADPRSGEMAIPLGASGKRIGYLKSDKSAQDMLMAELQSFARAVAQDGPVAVTGEEARDALAVALRVIEESERLAEVKNDR